jgi:hypothetical protein
MHQSQYWFFTDWQRVRGNAQKAESAGVFESLLSLAFDERRKKLSRKLRSPELFRPERCCNKHRSLPVLMKPEKLLIHFALD